MKLREEIKKLYPQAKFVESWEAYELIPGSGILLRFPSESNIVEVASQFLKRKISISQLRNAIKNLKA